ncbi:Probable soluble pyridine nucleotide transhydrogenase [Chlamydiales bacterium SCGC AB-751-O23]|jgi:NAD(P) transhydrogenase|nr:Probable soluble pyridine nucleotide transhydrogenase [Chlamydiales bacterium SCGC AB-751-O23]
MEKIECDLAVLGSGPAGQKAAIQGAKLGKSVVLIEKDEHVGGACLNSGTIPSKSLREAILDFTNFYESNYYGKDFETPDVSINDLNYRLNKVLEEQRSMILRQLKNNEISLLRGAGEFKDPHVIVVKDDTGNALYEVHAEIIILAAGSKPRNPTDVPFDDQVILDSTRLLSIDKVPKTLMVLGGGIVGSEYASFFAALGAKVTVVDKKDHLLALLDAEIGMHLQASLTTLGLDVKGGAKPVKIEKVKNKARVTLDDGEVLEADTLLYALGRIANIDLLNLGVTGLKVNEWGFIDVNPLYQTKVHHIYAVGDLIGSPALASTSMEQGRLAVRHAFGVKTCSLIDKFPIGIWTIPEISTCGYTEDQLKEKGFQYEVGRAYYYEMAKNHLAGNQTGLFKILFHPETMEILGIHIIGRGACEVIHIGMIAMDFNAHLDYFVDTVFNYPTYAEGYRIAALNGINKVKHFI